MPFQAPHYIYPTPDTPDMTGAIKSGLAMGRTIKADRVQQEERKKKDALEKEIGDIYKEAESKLAEYDKESPPAGQRDPKQGEPVAVQGASPEAVKMAGVTPEQPASNLQAAAGVTEKAAALPPANNNNKRLEINADMHNKIIGAYIKHGDYKSAEELKLKYMSNVEKLASLDPEAAEKVWNNSYLKKEFGGIDLKSLKSEWKVTISKDGNTALKVNSRTGQVLPVPLLKDTDQVKQMKEGDSLVMINPKDGKVSEIYKNSKPAGDLDAEKTFIKAETAKGTAPEVAAKNWRGIVDAGKAKGKTGGAEKKTALQKNFEFLVARGMTDAEAMSILEPGKLSKTKFVGGVYGAIVRSGGTAAEAQKAADEAGAYYETMPEKSSAPSSGVVTKTAKGKEPSGKVDIAAERAKADAAIKIRPDQAGNIKKKYQQITGQPY